MLPHDLAGSGHRIVLAHGFGQDRTCWGPLLTDLSARFETVAVDLPGHGEAASLRAAVPAAARLLADLGGRDAVHLGYSLGARHSLRVALDQPDAVDRLVLISPHPGIDDATAQAARRQADEELADHIEAVGVAAFVDEWLERPMWSTLPDHHRFEVQRKAQDPVGLANSLRLAGIGTTPVVWDRLRQLRRPVLLVVGERDEAYVAIAQRMASSLAQAELVVVADSGHAVHLEQPTAVMDAVAAFLLPVMERASRPSWR